MADKKNDKRSSVMSSIIAIAVGGLSFGVNKAISKTTAIQKIGADKYPGVAPFLASGAITAGAVTVRKHIKDAVIQSGMVIGSGIATFERLLNVEMVKSNLPPQMQALFAGEEDVNLIKVTPQELEQNVRAEAERLYVERTKMPQITDQTTGEVVTVDDLNGDSFAYREMAGDEDDDSIFRSE